MFKWFKQTNDKDDMPNTVVKAVTIVRARPKMVISLPIYICPFQKKRKWGITHQQGTIGYPLVI